jgi:hypothetical protein
MSSRLAILAVGVTFAASAIIALTATATPANAETRRAATNDVSAQSRHPARRARTRIEVRPLRGPLRRDCTAVFQERWIPQWGGRVLYAGQDCHWTRAPL